MLYIRSMLSEPELVIAESKLVHHYILLIVLYITDRSSTGSTLTIERRKPSQRMMRRSYQQTSYRLVQNPCGMMHPRDIPREPFLRKYTSQKRFPVSLSLWFIVNLKIEMRRLRSSARRRGGTIETGRTCRGVKMSVS